MDKQNMVWYTHVPKYYLAMRRNEVLMHFYLLCYNYITLHIVSYKNNKATNYNFEKIKLWDYKWLVMTP